MTERDIFNRFYTMRQANKAVSARLGPILQPAVAVFEDAPRYPVEDLVDLYWKYQAVRASGGEDTAAVEAFRAKLAAMQPLPDAPERIELWPEGNMPSTGDYTDNSDYFYNHNPDYRPFLYEMLVPEDVTPKGAIVFCAGGDHGDCLLHEAFQSCRDFIALGYQTFLLCNRTNYNPWHNIESGADCARALRIIRSNAAKYRIDPAHIAFAGFSNGNSAAESCIEYYSGSKQVTDYFPDYRPDELDALDGAPNAFLSVYGPRYKGLEFQWDGVVYPPTFFAVGRLDGAMNNLPDVYSDLLAHNVPVEVHTFAGVPHGQAGVPLIHGEVRFPNFQMWIPLADCFLTDLFGKA